MTAAQRLAFLKQTMDKEIQDRRDFGSVWCFQTIVKLAKPVRETTCFMPTAPYLRLSVQSVDPAQIAEWVHHDCCVKAQPIMKDFPDRTSPSSRRCPLTSGRYSSNLPIGR